MKTGFDETNPSYSFTNVGATPEEIEEVLGEAVVADADEWGRAVSADATPLSSFRGVLSDELVSLSPADRGAHLDTAYLLDDYLGGWTDCAAPDDVTVDDLLGFGGWYLIAHTSASDETIGSHLGHVPCLVEVFDRHFGTHLADGWSERSRGLAADIARAGAVSELLSSDRTTRVADGDRGHWQVDALEPIRLHRLEDGCERSPVIVARAAVSRLETGDVISGAVVRHGRNWELVDTGATYPARVAPLLHRTQSPV